MRIKLEKTRLGDYDTNKICPLLSLPPDVDWITCRGGKCALFVQDTEIAQDGSYYGHCGLIHEKE